MNFSDGDHYKAYIRSRRVVVQKKHGKYIHETLHRASEYPRGTVFRTITQDGHKIVVGYWGKKVNGKHPYFAVNSVLHPVGEKSCHFRQRLKKMGVKVIPGKEIVLNGVRRLTSDGKRLIISPIRIFR